MLLGGGVDLATGDRIAHLEPLLDASAQQQAWIGVDGSTVETVDASNVRIRVDVPAGALTRNALITVTPLQSSPLAGNTSAPHPGVKFEPEDLTFAVPATLTLDFSATDRAITNDHFIFWFTSPLTTPALYRQADPAASTLNFDLPHFSAVGGGSGRATDVDLAAWTIAYLASTSAASPAVRFVVTATDAVATASTFARPIGESRAGVAKPSPSPYSILWGTSWPR